MLKTSPAAPPAAPTNGAAVAVAAKTSTALAPVDDRTTVQAYLDDVAPVTAIVGRALKFTKGVFTTPDDEAEIAEDEEFIAHVDQVLIGWLKFNGPGAPPDRHMGLLYDGYRMPPRASLGDLDEALWEMGLDGKPADPWLHHIALPLQAVGTLEWLTFTTNSPTGRRAVGTLLRHYDRMRRVNDNDYLRMKKEWIDWLKALEPRTERAAAEIDEAISEYNAMIGINNRVARLTAEANSKRNEEAGRIDWQGMASFSGGWTIPASSSDGIQTIVQTCCNPSCGASHLVDFRVVDGLAEFRTYSVMEKSHDGIQDEDGARADEARPRAAETRARKSA